MASTTITITLSKDDARRIARGITLLSQLVDDHIGSPSLDDAADFDLCSDLADKLTSKLKETQRKR